MVLKKTYTLYLLDGADQRVGFEPALCADGAEAIGRARILLDEQTGLEAVEICFGEDLLFRIHRPRPMTWD